MACLLLLSADRGVFCFASRSAWNCSVSFIACHGFSLDFFFFSRDGRLQPWSPGRGVQVLAHQCHHHPHPLSCVCGFLVLFLVATERETLGTRSLSSGSADDRNMTPLLPWNSVHDVFFWFLPSPRIRAVRGDDGAPLLPGGQVTKGGA